MHIGRFLVCLFSIHIEILVNIDISIKRDYTNVEGTLEENWGRGKPKSRWTNSEPQNTTNGRKQNAGKTEE